ncbi:oxygenase MpaB family protein [Sphingobacterium sp. NGMCC 1.201703]|uniref:oxygenase MpaB family protein n=1 Tax=Sphingobacterium sp. NGMCC 1.201703 TaxID=3388657 RepID=UPI0039FC1262
MNIPERYKINASSFSYYWTKGIGAKLLDKLPNKPNLADADQYIPLLYQYDEACDRLVEHLHLKIGFAKGQQLIRDYLQGKAIDSVYDKLISDFMNTFPIEPQWLDWKKIQQGIALSQRSGLTGLIVLRDYCLMGGYESSAINKPLIFTGALKKGAVKRLTETVTFWVDITADQALRKGGMGIEAILLTRCIHSFARLNILKHGDWRTDKWGIPLNTWDMLATNLGFSLVYLVGLKQMKFNLLEIEINGIMHLWKYIGSLLGIPLDLLPDTEEEAIKALYYWTMTQKEGDQDSIALAQALMEEPIHAAYPRNKFGRKLMREVHLYYNHYLLGNYSCNLLGLEKTNIGKIAYFNILKNKKENSRILKDEVRQQQIREGRKVHERVKQIYLTYNYPT